MKCCLVCGKEFSVSVWHPHQKCCGKKCRNNYDHRLSRGIDIKLRDIFCKVCDNPFKQKRANNKDYCSTACKRLAATRKLQGLPIKGPKKHIKGSGYINNQGYKILSMKHPNSTGRGQILEHTLIMSNHLGRPLMKGETVHHKNGIRHDNRLENLELWSHSHPFGQRVEDKIKWCKEFLEQYGFTVIVKL
jgi:hypothetical protein